MGRRLHVCVAWLLLFLHLTLAPLAARAQVDPGVAESLMRASGMWEQLAGVAPQVRSEFMLAASQVGGALSEAEMQRVEAVIGASFAAPQLREVARKTLERHLDPARMPALRQWYGSARGRRITGVEERAAREQTDMQEVARAGGQMLVRMPARRRSLLEQLLTVTHAVESSAHMAVEAALAVQRGLSSVLPQEQASSAADLRAELEAQRPQLLQVFTSVLMASSALMYERLSTEDLARYVDFLRSDAGRHFMAASTGAVAAALVEGAAEMGRNLPGARDRARI